MKNRRPKILYVITKGNWGGAQRYVFDLATSIPADRFETVVAFGQGDILGAKLAAAHIRTIHIPSLGRDINPLLDLQSLKELIKIFRTEKPDVVHLNSSKIGGLGGLAARIAHVPHIIFTNHALAWNEDRFILSKMLIANIHWLTLMLSHTVIAVCQSVKQQSLRLPFIPSKKIVVIPNGIDSITFEEKQMARTKVGGGSEKIWIGTIAELHRNKGLDILIEAFAATDHESHNAALFIIGEGEERKKLEALVRDLGIEHKVHLIGFVDKASSLLKAFDIFVLPSRTEAFPYVILEAGLAQLPIIASAVGGIPEVITHMKTGLLVQSGDRHALSEAMQRLLTDSTLVAEISHGIRKEVENNFTKKHMVEQTLAVYNI